MNPPNFLVIKIGGSLYSEKRTSSHIDLTAVEHYARLIARLFNSAAGRLALVVGGGAPGHHAVRNLDDTDEFASYGLTAANFKLKWTWVQQLRGLGVRAFPIQVASMCTADVRPESFVLQRLIRSKALPVLSGDCIVGDDGSLSIVGSDRVPGLLIQPELAPVRIVALTDVPGILRAADSSDVLAYVDPQDATQAQELLWAASPWDTSDAMRGKLTALIDHAHRGAECIITQGPTGADQYLDHLLAPLCCWPPELRYTLIAQAPGPQSPQRSTCVRHSPDNHRADIEVSHHAHEHC